MPRTMSVLALVLGAVVAAAATGPAAVAAPPPVTKLDSRLKVHPLLQYGAQVEPDKKVRVIVQKERLEDDARAIAHGVGAEVQEEFGFVKAAVLEVPQRAALELARDPAVHYVSLDGGVQEQVTNIDASHLLTTYPGTIRVPQGVWNGGMPATGKGVAVAVLDTGVNAQHPDFSASNVTAVNLNMQALGTGDGYGHGTHVIGTINGRSADGHYIGIAPDAAVYSVKIADDTGLAHESDLLRGLQWVYDNRATTGIKVVNLSITSATAESYRTSVVDAAAEQLWFNGITVVVAAGNRGTALDATWYAPANDPYVITVGCLDDNQTTGPGDDSICGFSSRGLTQDGIYKPDVVAPGRKIYSALASASSSLAQQFPDRISVDGGHIRLSGTSMAAPVATGVVALVSQVFPTLRPDQMKWLLLKTLHPYNFQPDNAGVVNPQQMLTTARSTNPWGMANVGLAPNAGISVSAGSVQWGSAYWDSAHWDSAYWDSAHWDVTTYD